MGILAATGGTNGLARSPWLGTRLVNCFTTLAVGAGRLHRNCPTRAAAGEARSGSRGRGPCAWCGSRSSRGPVPTEPGSAGRRGRQAPGPARGSSHVAASSHRPSLGSIRLHSTDRRWLLWPIRAIWSISPSALTHQSQARPLRSPCQMAPGNCSKAHQSFPVLLPSTWWDEVAVPHRNPRGKRKVAWAMAHSYVEKTERRFTG